MLVLRARGGELEREFAFGVARQLFEPLLLGATPAQRDDLLEGAAAAAGRLVGVPAGPPPRESPATDSAVASLHGLYWLTANVAATQPLALAVDDLQWCDAGSLRWLAYLAHRLEDLPLLVIAGVGAGDPDDLIAEALAEAWVLRPQPLGAASVAVLARDALAADPDPEFSATCHAMTGGNPLFIRTLLTALADAGVAPDRDEVQRVGEIGPPAVARLVRLRLARLDAPAVALAGAAAVLGEDAPITHAAAIAGLEPSVAAVAATKLVQAGLLRPDAALSFVHPLERAAFYEAIVPLDREAAHAHAARLLAAEHARAAQIAAHLLHAPSRTEPFALDVLRDAAWAARRQGAPETAVAYLRRALGEPLDAGARAGLLFELGLAEKLVDLPAAAEHLRDAWNLLAGDEERRAQVGLQLARTLFLAGRAPDAVAAFEAAIALCDDRGELRRRLQADLLGATMVRPELYPIAERQLAAIDRVPEGDDVGALMLLAMTAYHDARRGGARAACAARAERALADPRLLDEEASSAFAYACRVLVVADRFAGAAAAYERALERARALGSITSFSIGMAFRGGLALHRGALAEAEADGRASLDAARAGGVTTALSFSLTYLAYALVEQGELEAAAAVLDAFEREAASFGDMPFFLLVRGRLRRAEGDAAAALEATMAAARAYESTGQSNPAFAAWRSEAALACLGLGERGEALRLAADEVRLARAWGAPRTLCRALRVAGLAEGGDRGLDLLHEALGVLGGSPARLERAKTLVELGAAVRRDGRRSDARPILRRGLDLADACGARPLAERALSDLRAAGARPRRAQLAGVPALTPSERRVADMAADGMTNRAIAQALFVTTKTIEVHLSNVYRKLDIGSRTQIAQALARPAGERRDTR
jgi:DNA-binding CsgD family transcriptional regulator